MNEESRIQNLEERVTKLEEQLNRILMLTDKIIEKIKKLESDVILGIIT